MVRSSFRLPLLYSIALFSLVVYGQMYAAPITDHSQTSQQQQQTTPQPSNDSAAQSQQSAPAATDSLPDDPATTAHIEAPVAPDGPTAVLDTSMGRMTCGLYAKEAPIAVANFIGLATGTKEYTDPATHKKVHGKPFYNGTTFHRVIPGFMIQGGDPTGTGEGDPGYFFNDEIDPNLTFNVAGRLAMANAGPNTNGSQFFITVGPQPSLDQHYTIFGQCDPASVLVAESITQVPRNAQDKPIDPVYLNKVTIVQPGQPMPPAPAPSTPPAATAPTPAPSQP
ncbi:MAG TPA: peptidylprolyl isomerase [Acidobacteriaceae bacterium]|nr:peptidylprolyl isomerase [Acidobacteriaceae bacterium]